MQSKNVPLGIRENPMVKSLYVQQDEVLNNNLPPGQQYWVNEEGINFVNEEGEEFVFIIS